ncbi:MAG: plasmid pRiA4b ORF-3 family protein [Nitriliruptoraceae bacterium]
MNDTEPPIYRLRVVLDDTWPQLWRRLEVTGSLGLDQLHEALQIAFGWEDRHLHRFADTPDHHEGGRTWLCPFEVAEGDAEHEDATPEEMASVAEVLEHAGDRLYYLYDYGDGWSHTIEVEAVTPGSGDAPAARCTGGARPGPPEDCGGVHGYELIIAASDPNRDPDALAEFHRIYGEEVGPNRFEPAPFDADRINRRLEQLSPGAPGPHAPLPEPIAALYERLMDPRLRRRLRDLSDAAGPTPAQPIDEASAARMVAPYQRLLEHIGDEGVALTSAGYLPPRIVSALYEELDLDEIWIGTGTRESDTIPVLTLRTSAQQLGLLRKHRGRLSITARGQQVRGDPQALLHHLAERLPLGSRDPAEHACGLLLLLSLAAERPEQAELLAAEVLDALGWALEDGRPITATTTRFVLYDNRQVLERLDVLRSVPGGADELTPHGVAFARLAVHTGTTPGRTS